MRRLIVGLVLGLLLGWLVAPPPAFAQAVARLFGTTSTGASVALQASDTGELKVSCQ